MHLSPRIRSIAPPSIADELSLHYPQRLSYQASAYILDAMPHIYPGIR